MASILKWLLIRSIGFSADIATAVPIRPRRLTVSLCGFEFCVLPGIAQALSKTLAEMMASEQTAQSDFETLPAGLAGLFLDVQAP